MVQQLYHNLYRPIHKVFETTLLWEQQSDDCRKTLILVCV